MINFASTQFAEEGKTVQDSGFVVQESRPVPQPALMKVVVTDISMPFGSMVLFIIKWSVAAIPALIILSIIGVLLAAIFGGILTAIFGTGFRRGY